MFAYTPDIVSWLVEHHLDEQDDLDLVEFHADLDGALTRLRAELPGAADLVHLRMLGHDEEGLADLLGCSRRFARSGLNLAYVELARLLNAG